MIHCQNCGNSITTESNYCRFCGTKFHAPPAVQPDVQGYGYSAPRPYAWKTDEFQTQTEARAQPAAPISTYEPPYMAQSFFSCPNCRSHFPPKIERRISTAGWIVFAIMMVVFFPLFWVGLLIREDVMVCTVCNARTSQTQR